MPLIRYKDKVPVVPSSSFVAPNATLIGEVIVGEKTSIWFGAVLRAEVSPIRIGEGSNVQDNSVVHTDVGFPVEIGGGTTIGHATIVHGAKIASNCLIGMGSTLLNGASIGENSMVAAGSLVLQGKKMAAGMLVMGSPAAEKRKLKPEEIAGIRKGCETYNKLREDYLKIVPNEPVNNF
jgi:carbonic anhydrase/acetyltransferase-like protein (isoleucine patch superfamily)